MPLIIISLWKHAAAKLGCWNLTLFYHQALQWEAAIQIIGTGQEQILIPNSLQFSRFSLQAKLNVPSYGCQTCHLALAFCYSGAPSNVHPSKGVVDMTKPSSNNSKNRAWSVSWDRDLTMIDLIFANSSPGVLTILFGFVRYKRFKYVLHVVEKPFEDFAKSHLQISSISNLFLKPDIGHARSVYKCFKDSFALIVSHQLEELLACASKILWTQIGYIQHCYVYWLRRIFMWRHLRRTETITRNYSFIQIWTNVDWYLKLSSIS